MLKQTRSLFLPVRVPHEQKVDTTESSTEINDDGEPPSRRPTVTDLRRQFRKRYYPNVTRKQWDDWHWQLANRITDISDLSRILNLSAAEQDALCNTTRQALPFAVTPYYASLLGRDNPLDPLRVSVIPRSEEFYSDPSEADDPLGESHDEAVPGLVHRYPDRVLFLVTTFCSTYCRYCTRSRVVGQTEECHDRWQKAIDYIAAHTEVRDVLISGGDPLTLTDSALDSLLSRIRAIPHVEFIRIGTKIPTVLPQRVTPSLTKILKKYHPLFISIHATHPDEFTPEAVRACARLADAGIPLGSQTVLLKGINDEPVVMKSLMHKLLMSRVRPYYLYQCDPVRGTSHLRTSVTKGLELIDALRGHTTGYAVPTFVIDAPGGGGKIPISANNVCGEQDGNLLIMNFEKRIFRYPQVNASREKLEV
jgi:lysine 2,3-aminomutase